MMLFLWSCFVLANDVAKELGDLASYVATEASEQILKFHSDSPMTLADVCSLTRSKVRALAVGARRVFALLLNASLASMRMLQKYTIPLHVNLVLVGSFVGGEQSFEKDDLAHVFHYAEKHWPHLVCEFNG